MKQNIPQQEDVYLGHSDILIVTIATYISAENAKMWEHRKPDKAENMQT